MKVYCVVIERDGLTTKSPGITSTEIKREELRFAAETLDEVWEAIEPYRADPECELIGLWQEKPQITVLAATDKS